MGTDQDVIFGRLHLCTKSYIDDNANRIQSNRNFVSSLAGRSFQDILRCFGRLVPNRKSFEDVYPCNICETDYRVIKCLNGFTLRYRLHQVIEGLPISIRQQLRIKIKKLLRAYEIRH